MIDPRNPHLTELEQAAKRHRRHIRVLVWQEKHVRERLVSQMRSLGDSMLRTAKQLEDEELDGSVNGLGEVFGRGNSIDNLCGEHGALKRALESAFGLAKPIAPGSLEKLIVALDTADPVDEDAPKREILNTHDQLKAAVERKVIPRAKAVAIMYSFSQGRGTPHRTGVHVYSPFFDTDPKSTVWYEHKRMSFHGAMRGGDLGLADAKAWALGAYGIPIDGWVRNGYRDWVPAQVQEAVKIPRRKRASAPAPALDAREENLRRKIGSTRSARKSRK